MKLMEMKIEIRQRDNIMNTLYTLGHIRSLVLSSICMFICYMTFIIVYDIIRI